MRKEVILVTGANGEIGHSLIKSICEQDKGNILALDVNPIDETLKPYCQVFIQGDILDTMLLGRLVVEYEIRTIYHMASILSTKAEYNPETAHKVNVEGTLNLLRLAVEQTQWQGRQVKFIYPSSIAAYGIPGKEVKGEINPVQEEQYLQPSTMYGCNKLYCEHLGRYYAFHYRQLAADSDRMSIDYRCIRFPGLISAVTIPTGGTSDYGPEMLHHAAQNKPYACFVRPDVSLPFMVMPDAVKSLLELEAAPRNKLSQIVYNVTSFSMSAQEFFDIVSKAFPQSSITFSPDEKRQAIVDSWPASLDDSAARKDWGWKPDYDCKRSFDEYLIPAVRQRYARI